MHSCGSINTNIMNQKYFIGVDISKSKVDYAVMNFERDVLIQKEAFNRDTKLESVFKAVMKRYKIQAPDLVVCCENTGIYNRPLERICAKMGIKLWVEHPLKIKRATTDMRGKSDRKDALRIAEYVVRYSDKAVWHKETPVTISELNSWSKIRDSLIGQKVALENQLREAKSHDLMEYATLKLGYKSALKAITLSIKNAEQKIKEIAAKDPQIQTNLTLITSIPGIGMQNALQFIIQTNNFKDFESAKHLACYAGVVPFSNQSGTIKKRDRVSSMANKSLKKLLHMAAMCAIRYNGELKAYYIRKVAEGKNKMSVLNAIRNKLVHRIYATVKRQSPYNSRNDSYQIGKNACFLT